MQISMNEPIQKLILTQYLPNAKFTFSPYQSVLILALEENRILMDRSIPEEKRER
jgi:hypothetical protein